MRENSARGICDVDVRLGWDCRLRLFVRLARDDDCTLCYSSVCHSRWEANYLRLRFSASAVDVAIPQVQVSRDAV